MWMTLGAGFLVAFIIYRIFFLRPKSVWKQYGVPEMDTSPALGFFDVILGRKTLGAVDHYAYVNMGSTQKFCGIVDHGIPIVVVKDMDLMKKLFIKEADHFVDRRRLFTPEDGILEKQLSSLQGEEWKCVRASVTPTFTTGKIRKMTEHFNSVAQEWVQEYIRQAKASSTGAVTISVSSAMNQYTVEVISRTAFGIKSGTIQNPDGVFGKMASNLAFFDVKQVLKIMLRLNVPRLSALLGLSLGDKEAVNFFTNISKQGLQSRMSGEAKRNDFLQLLVEAKKGELKAEQDDLDSFEKEAQINVGASMKNRYFNEDILIAQCITFFFAGFSTTSSFLTFATYALALHPDIQDKLRKEVNSIAKEDGNNTSFEYDDVGKAVYLDMVTCEVLRKFPATERHERVCTRDYDDAELGIKIPKGTFLAFPAHSVHHDKQYYERPDEFYPEHFTPEKKAARSSYAFTPFGMGPRNCIGMRFALIEVKSALAHIVHSFLIEPTEKTPTPLHGIPASFQLAPPKNLELKLTPIKRF